MRLRLTSRTSADLRGLRLSVARPVSPFIMSSERSVPLAGPTVYRIHRWQPLKCEVTPKWLR